MKKPTKEERFIALATLIGLFGPPTVGCVAHGRDGFEIRCVQTEQGDVRGRLCHSGAWDVPIGQRKNGNTWGTQPPPVFVPDGTPIHDLIPGTW